MLLFFCHFDPLAPDSLGATLRQGLVEVEVQVQVGVQVEIEVGGEL